MCIGECIEEKKIYYYIGIFCIPFIIIFYLPPYYVLNNLVNLKCNKCDFDEYIMIFYKKCNFGLCELCNYKYKIIKCKCNKNINIY